MHGQILVQLLRKHKLSQRAFARKLGCSSSTVNGWTQNGVPHISAIAVRCVLSECQEKSDDRA